METVPDSGQRLERSIERGRVDDENVPEFARVVEAEIRESYRVGSPTLVCRVTLTLSARVDDTDGADGKESAGVRTTEEMAEQVGDLLPAWTDGLAVTGAGSSVRPCTAQEITDFTRVGFDPSVAEDVEEAQLAAAAGEGEGTGLVWSEAGPIHHQVEPELYRRRGHRRRRAPKRSGPDPTQRIRRRGCRTATRPGRPGPRSKWPP